MDPSRRRMPAGLSAGPAPVQVAPPITPPGQKLTEEERLTIENLYLKIVNCQVRVQNADLQKELTTNEMRILQGQMDETRKQLSVKYGVDISRASVTPDGYIKGPPAAGVIPPAAAAPPTVVPSPQPVEPPAPPAPEATPPAAQ